MVLSKNAFIVLLIMLGNISFAQTAGEFLAQKKKRIEYLTKQVAALQVYIGYAQKGYSIAEDGLHLIDNIKKGDFSLHNEYFSSLKNVNPTIQKYARVKDIIMCNVNMMRTYKSAYKRIKESGQFTEREITYITSVFTKVLDEAADVIVQLMALITPDGYEMKDDERLQGIDTLYMQMQDKQIFVKRFSNEAYVLSVLRKKEKGETETSRQLHNIKQ